MVSTAETAVEHLETLTDQVTPRKPIKLPPTKQQITLTPEPPSVREAETNAGMTEILSVLHMMQAQMQQTQTQLLLLQNKSEVAERDNAALRTLLNQTTEQN